MNRLETYKQREIVLPVHVKERGVGGGKCFTTAILETKGAWRKAKYARPEAEVPRQQKKRTELRDPDSSFSNKRQKLKTQQKNSSTLRNQARSQRAYLTKRAASAGTTWARAIAARTRREPRPSPLPSAPRGGHVS